MVDAPSLSIGTDPDRLLSYAEIAEHTGIPERTVRTWPRHGLRVLQLGRHVRVRVADLREWFDAQYRTAA